MINIVTFGKEACRKGWHPRVRVGELDEKVKVEQWLKDPALPKTRFA